MILERVSQEEIMQKYYPGNVVYDQKVCNALRNDKRPDCSFHYSMGSLLFIDFARRGYNGDCFKIAMLTTGLKFPDILYRINKDFKLNLQPTGFHQKTVKPKYKIEKKEIERTISKMEIEAMDWTKFDIKYWNDRGISIPTLEHYNVTSCHRVWVHKSEEIFTYHPTDPIYRYLIRKPDLMEIYRPYGNKKVKFRSNCPKNILQGWSQLPENGDLLVITKAYKDLMNYYEMGYAAVSFGGETTFPEDKIFKMLQQRFKQFIVVYDNDEAGITSAEALWKEHKMPYWYIPKEYKVKDTNDFIFNYGYDKFKEVFKPNEIIKQF